MADILTKLAECEIELTLVDPHVFEPKDPCLQATPPSDAGRAKAVALAELLSRSPPSTDPIAIVDHLEYIEPERLHREVTVVFVDSKAARRKANALTHHLIPRPALTGTLNIQSKPPMTRKGKYHERKE
ncbi:MAG: hypothetical protein QF473_07180 [Planctomycetota bacterium]|jgi:hypothetical protein|nr:hypothetical protein [Planctomycetota bacterium]